MTAKLRDCTQKDEVERLHDFREGEVGSFVAIPKSSRKTKTNCSVVRNYEEAAN